MNPVLLADLAAILEQITALFEHTVTTSPIAAMGAPMVAAIRRSVDQFKAELAKGAGG